MGVGLLSHLIGAGVPRNADGGDMLGVGACDATRCGKFSDSRGDHEGAHSFTGLRIAISGVGGAEFIAVTRPLQALGLLDEVQEGEREITWHTEQVAHPQLSEPIDEITPNGVLGSHVIALLPEFRCRPRRGVMGHQFDATLESLSCDYRVA